MISPPRRPLILFVDDEEDVVDILARTFERSYDVLTASSGHEALALLQQRQIDLLVTDQKMPDMTGIELVARARAEGRELTAILLTAYTDPQDLIDAINKGQVFRYVTKPWDTTELMLTVKNALDHQFLREERQRLNRELQKRVDALSLVHEVTATDSALSSYEAIVGHVLNALPRILPCDVVAGLVAVDPASHSANLQVHCRIPVGEAALLRTKELALAAWDECAGAPLPEGRLVVRVTGERGQAAPAIESPASRLVAPLRVDGRVVGVLMLKAYRPQAFSSDDAKLLELIASQTGAAIRNLTAVLDAERRRIERMVECMADGVILTDARNELVVINPAAREMLHVDSPEKASAKYLQEILGFYPFELVRGWEYGGAQTLRDELRIFERTLHSTVSPVTGPGGALSGVVVVLRDITEQKQLEERKEEFVSIISHELRTPLTAISGALDLVLNNFAGDVNDKQRRYLSLAKDSGEKLNGIVDDLLDLSKFARGKMRMSFEMVHLAELMQAAADRYTPVAAGKGVQIDVRMPEGPAPKVLADPSRLGQVLNNLLTNAIKFTPQNGRVELCLDATPSLGGFAVLSCWNNGENIAEADLERIFEKFEQARSPRTRTVRGTGLGLAICRSIVEAHGGHIWAESGDGRGARFVVVLPVEPPQEILNGDVPEKKAPAPGERRSTVLVIDDEPDLAFIVKALLRSRGHRALLASSAEEGLALARRHRPDAIVADVRMPGLDGLALAEILRHDPETRGIPVLVVSVEDHRGRAFKAGASAFLQKPLDTGRVLATIDGLLQQRRNGTAARVLVVDADAGIRAVCSEVLTNLGYRVLEAATAAEAREQVRASRPEMLLLDLSLPDGDGFELLEEFKAERAASHMSVIFISARTETASKVRALKLGGDDYLVKPFDALELAARVERVLRRKEQELGASPTTRLPGSSAIEKEVLRRIDARSPFSLCYLDLDNLKAYNDHYGYAKADGVVLQTGDLLREVVSNFGGPGDFIGHIAGDDFVFITALERTDTLCQRVIEAFDRIIPLYYDKDDRERGYIEAEDRYGQRRRFPVMSVSVAAVIHDGSGQDHSELSRVAAELKKRAKSIPGSKYLRSDRAEPFLSTAQVKRAAAAVLEVQAQPALKAGGT